MTEPRLNIRPCLRCVMTPKDSGGRVRAGMIQVGYTGQDGRARLEWQPCKVCRGQGFVYLRGYFSSEEKAWHSLKK